MHDDHDNRAAAYCDEWDSLPGNIIDECGEDGPPLHFGHEAALFNVTMRGAIKIVPQHLTPPSLSPIAKDFPQGKALSTYEKTAYPHGRAA